jgi:hypothetical protein
MLIVSTAAYVASCMVAMFVTSRLLGKKEMGTPVHPAPCKIVCCVECYFVVF